MKHLKYILLISLSFCFFESNASMLCGDYFDSLILNENEITSSPKDSIILDYPFQDLKGKTVHLSDFRGKYVFVDLWYSGCGFCISANRALKIVHNELKNENIVFLSVSIDTNKKKWISSITKGAKKNKLNPWAGEYVPERGTITLYTGGSGSENEFIKKYVPDNSYPKLLFIGPNGELISDRPPRPDSHPTDQPEKLIKFINKYLKNLK